MAETAVSFLLGQLSTWIGQEVQLLGSLGDESAFILEEMGRMRAFLRVADEKQEIDPQLKEWVHQVRDIAFDAEDVIDKFIFRFADRSTGSVFFACFKRIYTSVKNLKARHQLVSEMRSIQSRLKRVSEGQQRYKGVYGDGNEEESCDRTWYDGRGDALLLEEAEVVGIDKPKRRLVDWLSYSDGLSLKVISVVGIGGLGKTTLVKRVFDDAGVKMRFTTHLWITVSNSFKLEELLRTMVTRLVAEIKQPPPEGMEAMGADEMKEFVYKFLQKRNYIIVLDDIWSITAWEAMKYAFPRSGSCGFIIITTRFQSIAHAASVQTNGHVYNLEPLNEQDSKTLFCRKAFVGRSCPSYLEGMADIVLKRCEGLPLAIVVIGGLLATKNNDVHEWEKFHRRLGDEIEGDHLRRITKLLSLSYYDLPYHLKFCFLYFSTFSGDHSVWQSRLIRLWISEGFIAPNGVKTMEEVAEDYVKELADRSLIQVGKPANNDWPLNIRVHDLIHAMLVSKSKEQSFVMIANDGSDMQWPSTKIRRLAIHSPIDDIKGCHNLRSLLVLDNAHPPFLSNLLATCRLLKVLELRGLLLEKIPDEVFKLYLLKYLGLKGTKVESVSRLIGKLANLETLDLRDTRVTELPVEVLELRQLRHLIVYHYIRDRAYRPFLNFQSFKAPYRIGCLSSLQTLSDIDADDTRIVKEIGKLTKLRELGIMKLRKEDGNELCISLAKLTSLESLHIASNSVDEVLDLVESINPIPPIRSLELRGRLMKVPQWISSLHGLTRMHLRWSRINEDDDPLEPIQHLPNLKYLELSHAYQGKKLCFKASGFQRLKKLWIIRLEELEGVEVEEGSMPRLQELYMWGCKRVEEVPSGMEYLIDLEYVDFSDMGEGFVMKIGNEKEEQGDKWKLGHISRVEIYSLADDSEWQRRVL